MKRRTLEDFERDRRVKLAVSDGVIVADKRDKVYYVTSIRGHLNEAVEHVVAAGRLLNEAKGRLKHGEWLPLLKEIPLDENKAQRLMAIAKHPILSNPAYTPDLPSSWQTLYELTKLSDEEIEKGISDGTITRKTKQKDIRKKKKKKPDSNEKRAKAVELVRAQLAAGEPINAKTLGKPYGISHNTIDGAVMAVWAVDEDRKLRDKGEYSLDEARAIYLQALLVAFPIKSYKEMSPKEYAPLQQGLIEELSKLIRSEGMLIRISPPSALSPLIEVGQKTVKL